MSAADIDQKWELANKVSDRIIDMINEERKKPGFSPTQIMAGQMLGLMGFMLTAPDQLPPSMALAKAAIGNCLKDMMESMTKETSTSRPAVRTTKPDARRS